MTEKLMYSKIFVDKINASVYDQYMELAFRLQNFMRFPYCVNYRGCLKP